MVKRKHLEDYHLRDVVNSARLVSQTGLMLPSALAQPSQQQSKEFCSDRFHLTFPLCVLVVYNDTLLFFTCQQKNGNFLKNPNNTAIHANPSTNKTKPHPKFGFTVHFNSVWNC